MNKLRDIWRVIRGDLSWEDLQKTKLTLSKATHDLLDYISKTNRLQNLYDNLYRERREVDAQIFRVSQCPDANSMRSAIAKLVADNETRMQAESKVIADVAKTMLHDRGVVL